MTYSRGRGFLAPAILAAIPSLLFLDVLLGQGVFYIRDVSLYHFPGKRILREIVLGGEFPFWNSWISAGQPLAANPAHEVFYPLTWLILLPDYVYGFQLLALIHVHVATLAMYALLRSMNLSRVAAVGGALSFGIGGFVLSGLNLFPFLFSAAWMPLTLLFGRRAILERRPRDFALSTIFLGVQCLVGEPVTLVQTGLLLGIFAIAHGIEARSARTIARHLLLVAGIGLGGLFISAVQTIPAIDHARDSVRSEGFTFEIVSIWSTPPVRVAEFFFPDVFGSRRSDTREPWWGYQLYQGRSGPYIISVYSGLLLAILAVAGLLARTRGSGLYLVASATSLLLASGSHTPLLRFLYDAGVARSIRYSEKFLIMGVLATCVFGALVLDRLLAGDAKVRRAALAVTTVLLGVAAAGLTATLVPDARQLFRTMWSEQPVTDVTPLLAAARTGWMVAIVRAAVLAVLLFFVARWKRSVASMALLAFVVVDLGSQADQVAPRTSPDFYLQPPPSITQLPVERDDYRVFLINDWTPNAPRRMPYLSKREHLFLLQRNTLAGNTAATYGVRGVMEVDFDLTSLRATNEFTYSMWDVSKTSDEWMDFTAAMSNIWYIGQYRNFDQVLAEARGDARWMQPIRWIAGRRYARYYFASDVVTINGRPDFVAKLASGRHDPFSAFVEGEDFRPSPARVVRWEESANGADIDVESSGVAFLVMSVTTHKYWTVTIDGIEVPSIPTNLGYQGVIVPQGRHRVRMRYHNPLIAAGAAVSGAALLGLLAVALRRRA